jgi:hypothetical protein
MEPMGRPGAVRRRQLHCEGFDVPDLRSLERPLTWHLIGGGGSSRCVETRALIVVHHDDELAALVVRKLVLSAVVRTPRPRVQVSASSVPGL